MEESSIPSLPSPTSLPSKLPSRIELVSTLLPICIQLKTVVYDLDKVANDINEKNGQWRQILIKLKNEYFVSLCHVDIQLKNQSQSISSNIDRSRPSDPSLQLLIDFYKYVKEMRRVTEDACNIVCIDIERVLEEKERGYINSSLSHTVLYSLKQMRVGLNRAVNLINSRSHA